AVDLRRLQPRAAKPENDEQAPAREPRRLVQCVELDDGIERLVEQPRVAIGRYRELRHREFLAEPLQPAAFRKQGRAVAHREVALVTRKPVLRGYHRKDEFASAAP